MNAQHRLHVRAASSVGGMARQFRVQYLEEESRTWHLYAAFRTRAEAEDCILRLMQQGHRVRLVDANFCPTCN